MMRWNTVMSEYFCMQVSSSVSSQCVRDLNIKTEPAAENLQGTLNLDYQLSQIIQIHVFRLITTAGKMPKISDFNGVRNSGKNIDKQFNNLMNV